MQSLAQTTIPTPDQTTIVNSLAAMSGTLAVVAIVTILLSILIWFMIFKRTGMNPWLSLLMLVPIANFIMLLILAFTEWPVQRALRMCRAQLGSGPTYPPPPPPPPQTYNTTLPSPPTPPTPMS
jgi:hypothetical protein